MFRLVKKLNQVNNLVSETVEILFVDKSGEEHPITYVSSLQINMDAKSHSQLVLNVLSGFETQLDFADKDVIINRIQNTPAITIKPTKEGVEQLMDLLTKDIKGETLDIYWDR